MLNIAHDPARFLIETKDDLGRLSNLLTLTSLLEESNQRLVRNRTIDEPERFLVPPKNFPWFFKATYACHFVKEQTIPFHVHNSNIQNRSGSIFDEHFRILQLMIKAVENIEKATIQADCRARLMSLLDQRCYDTQHIAINTLDDLQRELTILLDENLRLPAEFGTTLGGMAIPLIENSGFYTATLLEHCSVLSEGFKSKIADVLTKEAGNPSLQSSRLKQTREVIKKKRGRPFVSREKWKRQRQIADAWASGNYKTKAQLASELTLDIKDIKRAIDNVRAWQNRRRNKNARSD